MSERRRGCHRGAATLRAASLDKRQAHTRRAGCLLRRNGLAAVVFLPGIPTFWQGTELGQQGQRDPVWTTRYSQDAQQGELYKFLKTLLGCARGAPNTTHASVHAHL